ncbi:cytochrome c oxidase assembly protein [Jidongwangia harbinensis]|uniref:cytochrome c oxidase assembly protein n=1 Tax=Jidongwangia harbinensis TaxID=2878561 RepID=UPI001CDA418E|nr:cytochrome c oxidase assembly protein [Jidongwangia harbinensis]MCA2213218.1 cytochrome c oxidase assembly protein [Jidongwangia harbinensis]
MTGHGSTGAAGPAVILLLALGYDLLSLRAPGWSRWRAAAFLAGCAVLVAGLAWPVHDLTGHTAHHLLVAMVAPLGLVLGAPVTLLLRTLPVTAARRLTRVLRSRPIRCGTHPLTALMLTVGGPGTLYLTPLYARTLTEPALHDLVTLHFVLSGILFAWVIAGPDPAPHRPSVPARLILLGVAIGAHAALSQLLYAGVFVQVPVTAADRQAAATLMYYGGDLAELALAFALLQSRGRPRSTGALRWNTAAATSRPGAPAR